MAKLEIRDAGFGYRILLDGKDVSHTVTRAVLDIGAGHVPTLKLDVLISDMDIDCECKPEIPKIFNPYYKPVDK